MKTRKIKARRMWSGASIKPKSKGHAVLFRGHSVDTWNTPYAVIDISDPEALVEQVARVLYNDDLSWSNQPEYSLPWMMDARRVLASLGIIKAERAKKGRG